MKPSVGRIVHYRSNLGPTAAIIIKINGESVDLQVFLQNGVIRHAKSIKQGDGPGTWNWPPRF